jgi:hypothetical protein
MPCTKGKPPGTDLAVLERPGSSNSNSAPLAQSDPKTQCTNAAYSLHHNHSARTIVRVLPCGPLYRIEWPDTGPPPAANLSRCKAAALEWAEQAFLTEHPKMSAARRLKSLDNFWWSSSYVALIAAEAL